MNLSAIFCSGIESFQSTEVLRRHMYFFNINHPLKFYKMFQKLKGKNLSLYQVIIITLSCCYHKSLHIICNLHDIVKFKDNSPKLAFNNSLSVVQGGKGRLATSNFYRFLLSLSLKALSNGKCHVKMVALPKRAKPVADNKYFIILDFYKLFLRCQ